MCLCIFLIGCGDDVHLPSPAELAAFRNAGPVSPSLDVERLAKAETQTGPYRIVPGDVLELTMPSIIRFITAEEASRAQTVAPYICRVDEAGTMDLPTVGDIKVAGKTLSQIESSVIAAYWPKYVVTRPSVFARVLEYKTAKVSVTGAVENPGVYSLRSDQMSLVALLMEAGGIVDDGAAVIRIVHRKPVIPNSGSDPAPRAAIENGATTTRRQRTDVATARAAPGPWPPVHPRQYGGPELRSVLGGKNKNATRNQEAFASYLSVNAGVDELFDKKAVEVLNRGRGPEGERITESGSPQEPNAFVLPVKGLNIPFTDVVLKAGDTVIVEPLEPPLFSVVGLVDRPGNFPYPPDAHYNLMQALAFAGGLDRVTEPRYATIYRIRRGGTIASATLKVVNVKNGSQLTEALNTRIKPGDIIAVEQTPRTRTKQFLDTVFRINIGTYWQMNDAWEN
ncbi:MAG: SLBB domain-containing protein [Sedimentisphaerales bacterium]